MDEDFSGSGKWSAKGDFCDARFRFPLAALALGAMLVLAGCSAFLSDAPPVPDSTLVEVLTDLHLAKARSELDEPPPALEDSVLHHHGLTRADYDAALDYYAEHPDAYLALYDQVLNHLNAERMEGR